MKNISVVLIVFILFNSCSQQEEVYKISEKDKKEIEALKRSIPLVLANDGWEPYEKLFSKNYENWHMLGDQVRNREDYLSAVKQWYDAGNRATGSEVETIAFIPLSAHKVMYLHKQVEKFNLAENDNQTSRDIRFVSIFVKEEGEWKVDFTAFMDAPNTN
ncbi:MULTISPECIES: nuclear transport factor 2 family protein [Flavobacteriaceae]|uniref:nuclear transport factor 2 family protein n=1 Tax=Flavobacteriaceae TaxID=49546 RepID=UPI001491E99C|nr:MULTISPECIES: nuclear transport factor 2 family protein [Allomuricauda]MDC6364873.1 nuclear transport factor 2 family protein [Muricauda sp. AC10]